MAVLELLGSKAPDLRFASPFREARPETVGYGNDRSFRLAPTGRTSIQAFHKSWGHGGDYEAHPQNHRYCPRGRHGRSAIRVDIATPVSALRWRLPGTGDYC